LPISVHVVHEGGWSKAGGSCSADSTAVRVRRRAVGEQRHVALASGDHGEGVIGLELEGTATDVGGVNETGLEAKVF
jgi:hypothetical protein